MAGKHRRGAEPEDSTVLVGDEASAEETLDGDLVDAPATPEVEAPAVETAALEAPAVEAPAMETPAVSLLPGGPGLPGPAVVPGHGSARRAVREQRRLRTRRIRIVAAVVVAALLAGLAWFVVSSHGGSTPAAKPAPAGRGQETLLLQVVDAHQTTLGAVLLAHQTGGGGTGFGALVPGTLLVNAPGVGSVALAQTTTAGGPSVAAGAVGDAMGVTVDGGWALSTNGLASLVDAVGGIDVTVDEDIQQPSAGGGSVLLIPAGQRHLGGQLAATYATFLDSGSPEQQRLARLSTVVSALLAKLPATPAALSALVAPLATSTDSTMPAAQVSALLGQLRADAVGSRLSFDNLPTHPLDIGGAAPALVVDNNALVAFVRTNFALSVPKNSAGAPFTALVQNGVGTPGLDDKARRRLAAAGISYLDGANASSFDNPTSTVLIADATTKSMREGHAVAKALGLPDSDIKITAQGQNLADVVVVLGGDFKP